MNSIKAFQHRFVEFIPIDLEPGVIYISIPYATAVHLCPTGCGIKVVTPFTPTDWTIAFDGDTISLDPSIGNWGYPCQSHYWITNNRVVLAPAWSRERIRAGRARDFQRKREYFEGRSEPDASDTSKGAAPAGEPPRKRRRKP